MFSPCPKISKYKRWQLLFLVASFYAAALLTAVAAAILPLQLKQRYLSPTPKVRIMVSKGHFRSGNS